MSLSTERLMTRKAQYNTAPVSLGDDDDDFVIVRGLSRGEVELAEDMKSGTRDRLFVRLAMVEPKLTSAEVDQWFADCPAGDTVAVLQKIAELSKLVEGARKSGVPAPGE